MDVLLLSRMIKELVLRNDRVSLPGLGVFVCEYVPASFSDRGFVINPPYRRIYFRSKKEDDNLLVSFYSEKNGVDEQSARRFIDDFISDGGSFARNVQTSQETGNVIADVAATSNGLGYISLGSVAANTDKIKAVKVNGVEATVANIEAGTYKLSRPFNFVYRTSEGLNDLAQNFIDFIESADGQELVNEDYIGQAETVKNYTPYAGTEKVLTLTGSTSVQPLMNEFIIPAFLKLNRGITVNCSGTGSGQGETDSVAGKNNLGMISRELGSDYADTLTAYTIALDGIAVIVQKDVNLSNVTFDQLYNLYINGTAIPFDAE